MEKLSFPKLNISFELKKIAFSLAGISIHWYAIIIAVGVFLAIIYTQKRSRQFGVHEDSLFDAVFGGLIAGMIGARAFYVIFAFDEFRGNLKNIFNVRSGGLAIYGGIIVGLLVGALVCYIKKMKILPTLDVASIGFFIGQGLGRWGNFVNIEAFGSNTDLPWGMTSPSIQAYLARVQSDLAVMGVSVDPLIPVHPTFLYESLWCFLGLLVIHFYSKKRKFDGEILLMYIGWYSFGRFFIEGLRTDSLLMGNNMRVSRTIAGLLFVACLLIWIVVRGKIKRENDENYMPLYVTTDESKEVMAKIDEKLLENKKSKKDEKSNNTKKDEKIIDETINDASDEKDLKSDLDDTQDLEGIFENKTKELSKDKAIKKLEEEKKDVVEILEDDDTL